MENSRAFLIPFSHLDLFWLGEENECLSRGNRIITRVMQLCRAHPNFRFLIEDVVFVADFLKNHPEARDELKALVHAGQIEIGPKWAGIMQNSQLGEDLIRNTLYATAFTRAHLDYEGTTMHLGDLPGWTPQYPQLAAGLGIRYVIATRCGPKEVPLFYWQAPDGSKVLTWYSIYGYHWAWSRHLEQSVEAAAVLAEEMERVAQLTPGPILVHWGIDNVLPPPELVARVAEWNERHERQLIIATPQEFFAVAEQTPGLPTMRGEALSLWPYLDALFAQIVPLDVRAVNGLMRAEIFTSLACMLGLRSYPADELGRTWRRLLQGMDHNYFATGGEDTRVRKRAYRLQAIDTAQWLTEESLRPIAERVTIPAMAGARQTEIVPIVVFNPLTWDRCDVATAHVTYYGDYYAMEVGRYRRIRLVDETGAAVPFQQVDIREGVAREDTLVFTAQVPSLGYRTYYIVPEGTEPGVGFAPSLPAAGPTPQELPPVATVAGDTFVTSRYTVRVDRTTGEVTITGADGNLVLDRARLVAVEELPDNLTFRDTPTGRLFENALHSVNLAENGPVRARIAIQGRMLNSPVTQEIMLYRDLDRIDIVNRIDWQDVHPLRVQQLLPTGFTSHRVEHGVPFGSSSTDDLLPGSGPLNKDELPRPAWIRLRECVHWIDVTDAESSRGLFIATDRKSFDVETPTLRCNMLRICRANHEILVRESGVERNWRAQLGLNTARFSLYPHQGNWREHLLHRRGWELNNQLVCVTSNDPETAKHYDSVFSFLPELGPGLVVTALKQAEDGDGFILRFFEALGNQTTVRLQFANPASTARCPRVAAETDLTERALPHRQPGPDGSLQVRPYEIKTVRIKC